MIFETEKNKLEEAEMLRVELENERFSLWLGSIFLPWVLRINLAGFVLVTAVQITILFPSSRSWIFGACLGAAFTLAILFFVSKRMIAEHKERRFLYAKAR